MSYDYRGQVYQPYPPQNDNIRIHPYHSRVLGYNVYDQYYDPAYTAPRGCCGMPFAFWLFLLGLFVPIFWIIAACCVFSRNPYERTWARASLFALLFFTVLAIVLATYGGLVWVKR